MKLPYLTILSLLIFGSTAFGQFEQHKTSDAPFLTPEEAVAKMDISDDFQIDIFAAEPDIGEPIAFTFDDRGRVWVVENYNYVDRRNHNNEKPLTRIQIFEDTDSDGVFDEKKLFTDELTFSSGIAVGFGGVFVGTPPNLLFIPDKDGDDQPDGKPEVLLDGWGIQDRHETLNSFIWGPDGWLYGCHGVFTSSMVGKPGANDEDRTFIDAGVWRYHPTKKEFEVFARGLSNPWGFDFNDVGQGFVTCCVIPHLFHIVQGGYYHKQSKAHINPFVYDYITTIRTHENRLSAHGGARFYLSDVFPPEFRDQLFMCNIHQHQVLTDVMTRNGSSYIGNPGEDFLTTNDLAWVGFSVEIGPDGGVYILDWHDTDICGNKINFPNSGRIYRLMPKGVDPIERPNVGALSDKELVAMQHLDNDWFVRAARLNLQMRAAEGTLDPEVGTWLQDQLSKAETSPKRLRSLWALHVTKLLSEESLLELLSHGDEYVRAFTIQLLCEDRTAPESALKQFAELATNDPSPVVRLYLAAALQRLDHDQRWPILASLSQHAEDAEDNNIPRMLWFALEPMVPLEPKRSLELAVGSQLTNLQEHVSRRLVSGDLPPVSQRNHQRPGLAPPAAQKDIQRVAPGFQVKNVGEQGVSPQPEFRNDFAVQTHPLSRNMPCVLFRELDVPEGKATRLRIRASYHPHGNWQLRVLANKKVIHDQIVSYETVKTEWLELDLDLSEFAGQQVNLEVENRANDWSWEFAFWGKVEIVHPTTTASTEALPSPSPTPGQRPNILFCISDDQSYAHTGANGDPVVKTPGFDRIAKEGLRFVHAFCDAPTCGPSRSAILTGQPIWRLEEAGNIHSTLPAKFATYTELLADAGYATGYTGKAWSPGRLEAGGRSQNPAGPEFSSKTLTPPFKAIRNTDYAGNFADFLDQVPEDAPFCFWLGTSEPHRGYEKGAGELTGKDPDKVIVPPFFPDNEIVRSDFLDYFVEIEHFDSAVLRAIEMLEESGQLDNTIVVVTSDHGMPFPRAKASLYDAGTRVPLAIRWPGGITNPGRVVEGFVNLSDLAPTFLEAAGLEPPEMMTARSLLDLFEDQPNKDRDAAYIAMERHDGCRKGGKGYPCRAIRTEDYLYIHNFEPTRWPSGSPDASVCARAIPYGEIDTAPTKTFLMQNRDQHGVAKLAELAFGMRPAEELYDLKNDPHQMVNLAGSVEAAEIQATMRKRLFDHLEETADPRVVGGTVDWDYYPYYGRMKNEDWKVDPKP